MAITHFLITEIPDPEIIISTINDNPIVLNNFYPISEQNNLKFEKTVSYLQLYLFSFFKYKTHNQLENITSNESLGYLYWSAPLPSDPPVGNNTVTVIENNEKIKIIDIIDINETVEFIVIENIEGIFNWELNNNKLYSGQKIATNQFSNVFFTSLSEGGGPIYSSLNYKVGNDNIINPDIIKSILSIDTEALFLDFAQKTSINYSDDFVDDNVFATYNVIEETILFEISGGIPNKNAEVEIIINCPFFNLNNFNEVIINEEIIKTENETFNIYVPLNLLGKGSFKVLHYIVENNSESKIGQTNVNILNIDGNTDIVSITNFNDSLTTSI